MSMQGHVNELAGAITTLVSINDVDASRLFVLTNSEGAIHALTYQTWTSHHRFKGLVLTGAPGRPVGLVARDQVLAQVSSLANGDEIMKHYDACIAAFGAGKPVVPDASLPEGVKNLLASLAVPANLPFARELWLEDPAHVASQISEPMLVLIGKKDIQVDWCTDGSALQTATSKHGNVTFVFPDNADHVLKYEPRPREMLVAADVAAHYNAEDRGLDSDVVSVIENWFAEQSHKTL
jgi:hypothetical protein